MQLFPKLKDKLLHAINIAGQKTWIEGLRLKGNGLCHGIAGNGYFLHTIYRCYARLSSEETALKNLSQALFFKSVALKWKNRAFIFGKALSDPLI
jgi:hypothetical protein